MSFSTANINAAIVMTQYDLRGFAHPIGFRCKPKDTKALDATTGNFVGFAAGLGGGEGLPDESYVGYGNSSFDDYLAMCKRLAADCNVAQKEAIQLIVQEILKQSEEVKAEVVAGERQADGYIKPLTKDNRWGKAVLALAEAFEVPLHVEKVPESPMAVLEQLG